MIKLQRCDTLIGRFYVNKEYDYIFPSVTSILSFGKKPLPEHIRALGARAAKRGTVMHTYLENYVNALKAKGNPEKSLAYALKKTPLDLENQYAKEILYEGKQLFLNFMHQNFFEQVEPIFSEKFIYSAKYGFAGTMDFVYKDLNDGSLVLSDFKSASGPRKPEIIDGYALQLAAYSIGFAELFDTAVDYCKILVSHSDQLDIYEFPFSKVLEYQKQFLELRDLYYRLAYKRTKIEAHLEFMGSF